jgi:phosphatidylserine/phosphatidylglycerophosphate/cardiolipin synthase-like enzyme
MNIKTKRLSSHGGAAHRAPNAGLSARVRGQGWWRLAGFVLVAAALGCGGLTGPAEAGPDTLGTSKAALAGGVTQHAFFNDKDVAGQQFIITDRLVELIDSVPPGEFINIVIHSFTSDSIRNALINAHHRGVYVRVAFNGAINLGDPAGDGYKLAAVIGPGRYRHCRTSDAKLGCISDRGVSGDPGIMHTKFVTLSKTKWGTRAVAVTSANFTHNASVGQFNNMVVTHGDGVMFDGYNRVFEDMFAMRKNNDYQSSPNGYVNAPDSLSTSWFQPRADSGGGTNSGEASTDTVAIRLSKFQGGSGCWLKIAQAMFTTARPAIRDQLNRIRSLGCAVDIIYSSMSATNLDSRIGRVQAEGVHHKYFIYNGNVEGLGWRKRVFTGSHNWSGDALRMNDEVLVSFEEPSTVNAFEENWNGLWCRYAWNTGCGAIAQNPPVFSAIINQHSNKSIDIPGCTPADGAPINQYAWLASQCQKYVINPVGNGLYEIIASHSWKCLDVVDWSTAVGAGIIQWPCTRGNNQLWRMESQGAGVRFRNVHSNMCLDNWGWSTADGTRMSQYHCEGAPVQQFNLYGIR